MNFFSLELGWGFLTISFPKQILITLIGHDLIRHDSYIPTQQQNQIVLPCPLFYCSKPVKDSLLWTPVSQHFPVWVSLLWLCQGVLCGVIEEVINVYLFLCGAAKWNLSSHITFFWLSSSLTLKYFEWSDLDLRTVWFQLVLTLDWRALCSIHFVGCRSLTFKVFHTFTLLQGQSFSSSRCFSPPDSVLAVLHHVLNTCKATQKLLGCFFFRVTKELKTEKWGEIYESFWLLNVVGLWRSVSCCCVTGFASCWLTALLMSMLTAGRCGHGAAVRQPSWSQPHPHLGCFTCTPLWLFICGPSTSSPSI